MRKKDQDLNVVESEDNRSRLESVSLLINDIISAFDNDDGNLSIIGCNGLPGRVSREFGILVRALKLFGVLYDAEVVFPAADCQ
jgi:hypothetical protein